MDPEKLLRSAVGFAIVGLAGMLLAPVVLPAVARTGRPVAKGVMKPGLIMAARGQEMIAELGEMASDMLAEVRSELATEAGEVASDVVEAAEETA